jgi:hypothetical protein
MSTNCNPRIVQERVMFDGKTFRWKGFPMERTLRAIKGKYALGQYCTVQNRRGSLGSKTGYPRLYERLRVIPSFFLFFGAKKFSLWGKPKNTAAVQLLHNTMRRREEVTAMVGMSPRAGATACSERVAAEGRGGARENGCV